MSRAKKIWMTLLILTVMFSPSMCEFAHKMQHTPALVLACIFGFIGGNLLFNVWHA
jgi:hypothetical protein